MNNLRYLNGVLTVIAVCLVLLTLSVVGVIPKATASTTARYATVPLNADGSINVKIDPQTVMDVNLVQLRGYDVPVRYANNAYFGYIPTFEIAKPTH
ncbi:MAG TPA: hypothetical protein VGM63_05320 [Mucilaginibacter sp.]